MPKRSCFRTSLANQHVNGYRTLLESAWQHLYPIFSSTWYKSETSLLVRCEILRLYVNTLTVDGEYFGHKRENLQQPIQKQLCKKQKAFCVFDIYTKFGTFSKQTLDSQLNYFLNYWLRKTWLLKCIKVPVSEHPLEVSVLKVPKHCCSLNNITLTQFFYQFEVN